MPTFWSGNYLDSSLNSERTGTIVIKVHSDYGGEGLLNAYELLMKEWLQIGKKMPTDLLYLHGRFLEDIQERMSSGWLWGRGLSLPIFHVSVLGAFFLWACVPFEIRKRKGDLSTGNKTQCKKQAMIKRCHNGEIMDGKAKQNHCPNRPYPAGVKQEMLRTVCCDRSWMTSFTLHWKWLLPECSWHHWPETTYVFRWVSRGSTSRGHHHQACYTKVGKARGAPQGCTLDPGGRPFTWIFHPNSTRLSGTEPQSPQKRKKKCLNFDPSGIGNPGNNYWEDHQKHLRWINVQKERLFVFPDAWRSRPNGNFTESSPGHWDSLPIAEAVQSFVWFWISAWSELQPSDFSRQIRLTNTLTWQPHPRAHQYLLDVFCVTFALQNGLFHTSYRLSFSGRFGAILSSERP